MSRYGRKGFNDLLNDVKTQPRLRETLKEARANVYLYDKSGHTMKAKRARALKQFTEISKAILVADNDVGDDISEKELYQLCFKTDNVVEFACR